MTVASASTSRQGSTRSRAKRRPRTPSGLSARRVVHTGDVDTCGLAILDRLRARGIRYP